jgi:hypothetical protein
VARGSRLHRVGSGSRFSARSLTAGNKDYVETPIIEKL